MHLVSQKARDVSPVLESLVRLHPRLMYRGGPGGRISMRSSSGDELHVEVREDPDKRAEVDIVRPHSSSQEFDSVAYLHLDANEMTRTSLAEDENPRMAANGSNLASALAWMKGAAEDDLAQITTDLRQVVPGVKRIRTLRERVTHRRMEKLDIDGQPIWRPVDESLDR
jgi:predicted ATPase